MSSIDLGTLLYLTLGKYFCRPCIQLKPSATGDHRYSVIITPNNSADEGILGKRARADSPDETECGIT